MSAFTIRGCRRALDGASLLLFTLLLACSGHSKADDPVVAKSDTVTMHASDVKSLLDTLDPAAQRQAEKDPSLLLRLVKQEMGRRALLQQARAQKWEQRPEVAAQIERSRSEIVLNAYLQSVAAPPSSFPSDAELQEAYKLNQQRFIAPRTDHLAHIFIAAPADAAGAKAAKAKADRLAAQLKSAPDRFAELARTESDDKASAAQGGDLGVVAETQLAPEIRGAVQGLPEGGISEPVNAAGGWHLLRLIETHPASPLPFEKVKDELTRLLRQQRTQENAATYFNKLLADEHTAIDEISLQKATPAEASVKQPIASER